MTGMNDRQRPRITRRDFLSAGAAALSFTVVGAGAVRGTQANSRIKVGVVGLGDRGRMIAGMLQRHGGYEIVAVADYFEQVANAAGDRFGVSKASRFWGLSGYKAVIATGFRNRRGRRRSRRRTPCRRRRSPLIHRAAVLPPRPERGPGWAWSRNDRW